MGIFHPKHKKLIALANCLNPFSPSIVIGIVTGLTRNSVYFVSAENDNKIKPVFAQYVLNTHRAFRFGGTNLRWVYVLNATYFKQIFMKLCHILLRVRRPKQIYLTSNQESIQSSTTPDLGNHTRKHITRKPRSQHFPRRLSKGCKEQKKTT